MLSVARTPTCINYVTVTNAIKYLKPQGLRKVWIAVPAEWVDTVNSWHADITAVDDSRAVPGVSKAKVKAMLVKYGWDDAYSDGRTSAGWYLHQFINLGFVLRDDVLDTLLVHDADMMLLPGFGMFGQGTFSDASGAERPTFRIKVGGLKVASYEHAHRCLTGEEVTYPGEDLGFPDSYVAHSWIAYRPFVKELLDAYSHASASRKPSQAGVIGVDDATVATWMENAIRCLNPDVPDLGFGESASYVSYVLEHHGHAFEVERDRCWERNLQGLVPAADGYCCPTDGAIAARAKSGLQYAGFELGHPVNSDCGYDAAYFARNPYPPAEHPFWTGRNVSFRSGAASLRPPRREARLHPTYVALGCAAAGVTLLCLLCTAVRARGGTWRLTVPCFGMCLCVAAPLALPRVTLVPLPPDTGPLNVSTGKLPWWVSRTPYDLPLSDWVSHHVHETRPTGMEGVMLHTEFNRHAVRDQCFKNTLVVLSALAAHPNTTLIVWFDEPSLEVEVRACFQKLLDHAAYGKVVQVRLFRPEVEIASVAGISHEDKERYVKTSVGKGMTGMLPNFSNLRRYLMLYNYGGIWLDTDVLVLRSLLPLAGLNWAYGCPETFDLLPPLTSRSLKYWSVHINGAVLSASAPRSDFMLACISRVLYLLAEQAAGTHRGLYRSYYKWGGNVFWHVRRLAVGAGQPTPFLTLPCAWFDVGWTHSGRYPDSQVSWSSTWSPVRDEHGVLQGRATMQDVESILASTAFAFHFHGSANWTGAVSADSIGSLFKRHFEKVLGL